MKYFYLCFILLLLKVSAQSQIIWNMGMNIANSSHDNMHPRLALDAAGNPLVIWGRMSDQSVLFSRWNGTAFTPPLALTPPSLTVASASWMGPDIATHGDTVYVVIKQTPEADTASHIYIIRSFDGGQNFGLPVKVDNIADSISRFPTVTVDALGNPVVAFMKFNFTFGDSRWVVTRSSDFGNTFSTDVKASGWSGATGVCDCCPGAIVSDGNTAAMLYRNNLNNIRDTWMGVSTTNAASFSSGCTIDNNNWMLMSCPSTGPDGILIGDSLFTVFMNGSSGTDLCYLSTASVSGLSVNSVSDLTGTISGLSMQNYPRIASDGNAVGIVWKQAVNGTSQLPILFTSNLYSGFPATYDTVDLGDITNSDVAVSNGKVFVVWQDDNSGTVKYRSGTYTPSSTSINVIENQTSIRVFPNPVTDVLVVRQLQHNNLKSKLILYNSLGIEAKQSEVFPVDGVIKLDISYLPSGIYYLKLISDKQSAWTQFIKN